MGCISSKLFNKELKKEIADCAIVYNANYANHVVSLTSSTLGVLKLGEEQVQAQAPVIKDKEPIVTETTKRSSSTPPRRSVRRSPPQKGLVVDPEVINAWELMSDLEEEGGVATPLKKSPKSQVLGALNPSKFFNSPKRPRKVMGKENKRLGGGRFTPSPSPSPKQAVKPLDSAVKSQLRSVQSVPVKRGRFSLSPSPNQVLKPLDSYSVVKSQNRRVPILKLPVRSTPDGFKRNSFQVDSRSSTSRRSLSPLFDPKLIESFERELQLESEEIKIMVSSTSTRNKKGGDPDSVLKLFERRCPSAGENRVVIYTTTLRGIRKTFEDCNVVRSIIESHQVHFYERDVSMDSGYREELRKLLGRKDVKVPLLFVKGRLVGGAEEVVKLEEEGKLDKMFNGIPRDIAAACEGCGGLRFVMCMECSGSCKVLDEVEMKKVKCENCNENGLVQCPICCC